MIPEDHHAARDLQQQFLELGRQASPARSRWSLRGRRPLIAGVAVVLTTAAAAGATKTFIGVDERPVRGDSAAGDELQRVARDTRVSSVRASDPGGGAPWGLRSYTSRTGQTCLVAGRVVGGRIGVLTAGRFKPYGSNVPGSCARPGQHLFMAMLGYGAAAGSRSVLFGQADRQVKSLRLVSDGGSQAVSIADDGLFIVVRRHGGFRGLVLHADAVGGPITYRLR